jgi:arabinose-5-phosphate isomerase
MKDIIKKAAEVLDIEIEGLKFLRDNLGDSFSELVLACEQTLDNGGKLVVAGIGKSGHIGQKISATLASTGSTSVFMHPVEAMHGDLGILRDKDMLISLSYSGETEELLSVLPAAKRLGVKIAAVTGIKDSRLTKWSDLSVIMNVPREACPFNLAPTTTTTALLALGDALAMVLLMRRGFSKNDYGRLHPGGAIGKAVTLTVADVMRTGERFVAVSSDLSVKDTLLRMTGARSGSAVIVDENNNLTGIFTDGDFRRHIEDNLNILNEPVSKFMTSDPASVFVDALAVEILKILEEKHIDDIVVVDDKGKPVGIVDIQDLPGLKLM